MGMKIKLRVLPAVIAKEPLQVANDIEILFYHLLLIWLCFISSNYFLFLYPDLLLYQYTTSFINVLAIMMRLKSG